MVCLAEKMVQTVKAKLRLLLKGDWKCRLSWVLYAVHTSPNSDTGKPPAELTLNRRLKTLFDQVQLGTKKFELS